MCLLEILINQPQPHSVIQHYEQSVRSIGRGVFRVLPTMWGLDTWWGLNKDLLIMWLVDWS